GEGQRSGDPPVPASRLCDRRRVDGGLAGAAARRKNAAGRAPVVGDAQNALDRPSISHVLRKTCGKPSTEPNVAAKTCGIRVGEMWGDSFRNANQQTVVGP